MITYSDDKNQDAALVADLFRRSGIKRPFEDTERIKRMIEGADLLITAWQDGCMVGVARAITDYSYCCYLSDLAVDASCQKQGVGKELIRLVQERIGDQCSLVLISAPNAVDFYTRLGLQKSDKAFVIPRLK